LNVKSYFKSVPLSYSINFYQVVLIAHKGNNNFLFYQKRPINSVVAIGTTETKLVYTTAVIETPQLWLF